MSYSQRKRESVYKKYKGKCYVCGKELQIKHIFYQDTYMVIRRLLPKKYGGGNELRNLIALCRGCNNNIKVQVNFKR